MEKKIGHYRVFFQNVCHLQITKSSIEIENEVLIIGGKRIEESVTERGRRGCVELRRMDGGG